MQGQMSLDWQPPDWLAQAATVAGSLVAGGAIKPVWDWWRDRGKEQREARREQVDAATELREELRRTVREMRADLDKRDDEIEAVKREMFELLAKIAALTAENHEIRAERHRLKNWVTVFYADLQLRWDRAGLPLSEFPRLPPWITSSSAGPTASFQESDP